MTEELSARPDFPLDTVVEVPIPGLPHDIDLDTGEVLPAERRTERFDGIEGLYQRYFRELGRLAFLLISDLHEAEDVVADVFLKIAEQYDVGTLEDPHAFLCAAVTNRARSVLRHRVVHDKALPKLMPGRDRDSTSDAVLESAESAIVVQALQQLPVRQREAVVLRYYADLSEKEIATAMGLRPGSVKSHTARGIALLRRILDPYMHQFM